MPFDHRPPEPVHIPGILKGEEIVLRKGREAGRGDSNQGYRSSRDSTSIESDRRQPILPSMPSIPPA